MSKTSFTPRVFSGIKPSGGLTLGNYLGAIKRFVGMQGQMETIYCVVDMHAITVWQDPKELANMTREVAAGYLAAGLDPSQSILFNQSQVAAHAELGWIFNCVARVGWMNRMTQFKDKAGSNAEKVSLGLYAYPALMAADILLYHATHVPVGEDQKQHVELTRDIAAKFNHDFKTDFFPLIRVGIHLQKTLERFPLNFDKIWDFSDFTYLTEILPHTFFCQRAIRHVISNIIVKEG